MGGRGRERKKERDREREKERERERGREREREKEHYPRAEEVVALCRENKTISLLNNTFPTDLVTFVCLATSLIDEKGLKVACRGCVCV